MKSTNLLRTAVFPVLLFSIMAFTADQPKKGNKNEKGNKQEQSQDKGQNKGPKIDNAQSKGHRDNQIKQNNGHKTNNSDHSASVSGNHEKKYDKNRAVQFDDKHHNGNSYKLNGKRDLPINWNLYDFANRKHPKKQKKITICHNPTGNSDYGVTIRISENALKTHLNHGDQIGACSINYSDRWSTSYVKSRENVYNTYEQTWETMSYSEALLRLAAEKLLGIRSNLDQSRSGLSPQEVQRREALIFDLQNNMNSLDSQLGLTRQRLDSDVNIIIQL